MSAWETAPALIRDAAQRLREIGAGNPLLEAEYLLAHAAGFDRVTFLRRDPSVPLPEEAIARFTVLLQRRLVREPLQYVLGGVPFCEVDLEVGPGVLIPRSETEILVERVSAAMRAMERDRARGLSAVRSSGIDVGFGAGAEPGSAARPVVIDVGTGSGAILLALLHRFPEWIGIGCDRSPAALTWACRNLERCRRGQTDPDEAGNVGGLGQRQAATRSQAKSPNGPGDLAGRVLLAQGDLLAAFGSGRASVIVSNPPYIRTRDIPSLASEIRDHEPLEALDGGRDGLGPFRALLPQAAQVLAPGGLFAVELAPDQVDSALDLMAAGGCFERMEGFRDLAGRWRGLLAWRAQSARMRRVP